MARNDSLRRRKPFRDPLPRILILCEGKTEKGYFNHLRQAEKIPLFVQTGRTPKSLVQRAVEMKETDSDYDEVWCVFDIDVHPYVSEAKQQARNNNIELAISNPCFELWALLHFEDQTAHIERERVQSRCRKHMPGYVKDLPCDKLLPLYPEARKRAENLDKRQESIDGVGGNPSTGVYRLVQRIKSIRPR